MINISWEMCQEKVRFIVDEIRNNDRSLVFLIYGVPRGGIPPALMLQQELEKEGCLCQLTTDPKKATIFIDDLIDSGKTAEHFKEKYNKPFFVLFDKRWDKKEEWLVFPWEQKEGEPETIDNNIIRILEYIGENPEREGLKETPARMIKSFDEIFAGYKKNPMDYMKVFEEDSSDEMVILKGVEFYSTCEHHFLPFFGKAHIAYIPGEKVIGISKLARVLEVFSRRLQIQERICNQITETLNTGLNPLGSACVLEAQHFCMTSRGVQKQNSIMVTSSLTGIFRQPEVRAEFFQLVKG